MTREELLFAAKKCVCGDRENEYGSPEDNFKTIAAFWGAYIKQLLPPKMTIDLNPEDVAAMMALLKIARISSGQCKADNWIDLAGYAACGAELQGDGND